MAKIPACSRMEHLRSWMEEMALSECEAVEELLLQFYEAAGFSVDVLAMELASMSESQRLELYLGI